MKKPPLRGKSGIPYSHLSNDYLHCTQEEIAEELGVSQQYVQQVEKRALVKFKKDSVQCILTHGNLSKTT